MKKYMSNKLAILLFVLPAFLLFTTFIFVPIVQVFLYSFTEWNGVKQATFIGLENYIRLFRDSDFIVANKNQLIFAVLITVYQMGLATIFAIAVSDPKLKGRKFLRIAYFIPVVLSVTVVCQLWLAVLNPNNGLLNTFLRTIGSDYQQKWLSERYRAIYVVAFVNAWQWMGYQFALIVAGVKTISADYYEAAKIDGASTVQSHFRITIPLLRETYKFCLVISVTGGIKAFTEMFIMTKGGPGTATYTLTYMMYSSAFRGKEYGYGLSAAVIMVLECFMGMLVINYLLRDRDEDGKMVKKNKKKAIGRKESAS